MSIYTNFADTARNLLSRYGTPMSIARTVGAVKDPVTGIVTPGTDQEYTPNGFMANYKHSEIDGTRIRASDLMIVLDDTVEPLITDKITVNDHAWTVVDIMPIEPTDTPIIYKVQVRK